MNKKCKLLGMILVVFISLIGCGEKSESTEVTEIKDDSVVIYYVDASENKLRSETLHLSMPDSVSKSTTEILEALEQVPESGDYKQSIPSSMKYLNFKQIDNRIVISFTVSDEGSTTYSELLCKASITKSLCQISGIDSVEFDLYDAVGGKDNEPIIETYEAISFVDVTDEGGYVQKGEVTIYFANQSGDKLLEYRKAVEITNNVSLEQIVVESLIEGPLRDGYEPTIPKGTELRKISVKDGVCYVDFNSKINSTMSSCIDVVPLYSIVNSLCELPTISKVQFMVNGEKQEFYHETIAFDGLFERQLDIIE